MSEHNPLDSLRMELQVLPPRHRRAVLKALTPFERAQILSLLDQSEGDEADGGRDKPEEKAEEELLGAHSTLIASRLESALGDPQQPNARFEMTPTAQRHLLAAALSLRDSRDDGEAERAAAKNSGRSLLCTFGAWLCKEGPR
jgi:hypothetical protein